MVILSFSVLTTILLLISGGKKGAMMEASKRVMVLLDGKAHCSRASFSMASQNSSTCTSSETWHSGHVNFKWRTKERINSLYSKLKKVCGLLSVIHHCAFHIHTLGGSSEHLHYNLADTFFQSHLHPNPSIVSN